MRVPLSLALALCVAAPSWAGNRTKLQQTPAAGARSWLGKNFKVHEDTRTAMREVRSLQRQGKISEAAETLVSKTPEPMGLFDRWAQNRTRRALANASMKALKKRSGDAELERTADALDGINTLRDSGKLSFFGSLRAGIAKQRAIGNMKSAIKQFSPQRSWRLGKADSTAAVDSLSLIAELGTTGQRDGVNTRSYRRAERMLVSRLTTTANKMARSGDLEGVQQVFGEIAGLKGFDEIKADKIVERAAEKASKQHLESALKLSWQGHTDEAAQSMFGAMQLQMQLGRDPEQLFKRGGALSYARAYSDLRRQLRPQIDQLKQAYAAQLNAEATTAAQPAPAAP